MKKLLMGLLFVGSALLIAGTTISIVSSSNVKEKVNVKNDDSIDDLKAQVSSLKETINRILVNDSIIDNNSSLSSIYSQLDDLDNRLDILTYSTKEIESVKNDIDLINEKLSGFVVQEFDSLNSALQEVKDFAYSFDLDSYASSSDLSSCFYQISLLQDSISELDRLVSALPKEDYSVDINSLKLKYNSLYDYVVSLNLYRDQFINVSYVIDFYKEYGEETNKVNCYDEGLYCLYDFNKEKLCDCDFIVLQFGRSKYGNFPKNIYVNNYDYVINLYSSFEDENAYDCSYIQVDTSYFDTEDRPLFFEVHENYVYVFFEQNGKPGSSINDKEEETIIDWNYLIDKIESNSYSDSLDFNLFENGIYHFRLFVDDNCLEFYNLLNDCFYLNFEFGYCSSDSYSSYGKFIDHEGSSFIQELVSIYSDYFYGCSFGDNYKSGFSLRIEPGSWKNCVGLDFKVRVEDDYVYFYDMIIQRIFEY